METDKLMTSGSAEIGGMKYNLKGSPLMISLELLISSKFFPLILVLNCKIV